MWVKELPFGIRALLNFLDEVSVLTIHAAAANTLELIFLHTGMLLSTG